MIKKILVTGGNGFIGQNFINLINQKKKHEIVNIDSLTGSSDRKAHKKFKNVKFYKANLTDKYKINKIVNKFRPNLVVNFAAHSHVDKSIKNSQIFLENM